MHRPLLSFCVLSLISSRVSAGARQLLYISLCVWSCLCQIVVSCLFSVRVPVVLLCSWFLKWLSPFVWTHAYSSKNNACYGVQLRFLWIFLLRSPVTRSAQHTIRNTCRWVELGYPRRRWIVIGPEDCVCTVERQDILPLSVL